MEKKILISRMKKYVIMLLYLENFISVKLFCIHFFLIIIIKKKDLLINIKKCWVITKLLI